MSRKTKLFELGALAVVVFAVLVALPRISRPASATAACGDTQVVQRYDGLDENPSAGSSSYAARATITERYAYLCTSSGTSAASAWVMLASGPEGLGHASTGFAKIAPSQSTLRFYEYWDGEEPFTRYMFANVSPGTNHTYSVVYSFTDGKVRMYFDGSLKATTPFSIESGEWPTPWEGQFYGETWDRGDDIPGTPSARVLYQSVGVIKTRGGAYVAPQNYQVHVDLPVYKIYWYTVPTKFDIYTQR